MDRSQTRGLVRLIATAGTVVLGFSHCTSGDDGGSTPQAGSVSPPAMLIGGASGSMQLGASGAAGSTLSAGASANPMAGASGADAAGVSGGMAGAMVVGGMGGMDGAAGTAGAELAGTSAPPPAGDWGTADPAMEGSFATMTESGVGPDGMFTLFRPTELTKKHPVITWGNGTGTTPPVYSFVLSHLASHGFVIIASNSMNVAQGTPPPMVAGVTWVIEQNDDPMSPLFQHIDVDHIGATGHSQGAFATSSAAASEDPNISVWAPIQGARSVRGQHGPGLLICGGMDTTVPCSGTLNAFNAISTLPVMYAELKAASHTNWFGGFGTVHPYVVVVTGWMRVHLMGDTELEPMFYGPSCTLCGDDAWVIMQKMLD